MSGGDIDSEVDRVTLRSSGRIYFQRAYVGGLPVAALDRKSTARLTIEAALSRRGSGRPCLFFTTTNGQVVSLCAVDPDVRHLFEQADLISADGMSVVFASRLGSASVPERVCTTDGFHDAAAIAAERGARFFFLGATDEVNALAVERIRALYPKLEIVGHRNGYFGFEDEPAIVDEINRSQPDVLWIGLGVPRQEQFVAHNLHRLTSVGLAMTCGGLFDFLAGKATRAPNWMQAAGLEWAYRMWREPRRLTWRYATTNPHAAYYLLRGSRHASDGIIELTADV
jgi:N-acetylglucosaminyldiphosphoundecaprenol N-acetyl-beta-D-mannosaminyltransferase